MAKDPVPTEHGYYLVCRKGKEHLLAQRSIGADRRPWWRFHERPPCGHDDMCEVFGDAAFIRVPIGHLLEQHALREKNRTEWTFEKGSWQTPGPLGLCVGAEQIQDYDQGVATKIEHEQIEWLFASVGEEKARAGLRSETEGPGLDPLPGRPAGCRCTSEDQMCEICE